MNYRIKTTKTAVKDTKYHIKWGGEIEVWAKDPQEAKEIAWRDHRVEEELIQSITY